MTRFVSRAEMDAISNEIYPLLPVQFRDVLPAEARAIVQSSAIFRSTLELSPQLVNEVFTQVQYSEGSEWLMWKLVAAFYLVEKRMGPNRVRQAGEHIYATMPWPPMVRSLADALRFTELAYSEAHLRAPAEVVGCWRVEHEQVGRICLIDDTPYPCYVNEGVIAGVCRAFSRQRPTYTVLDPANAKRSGGLVTRYDVLFDAA